MARGGGRTATRSGQAGPPAPPRPVVPRWVPLAGLALSLAGVGVSVYLTISHFTTDVTLACPNTGVINCAKVTSSPYASIAGVPVALLGLGYFLAATLLHLPAAWRAPRWSLPRLGLAVAGVAMVLWLVYVELFRLNAICLWCTVVHVLAVASFGVTAVGAALREPGVGR